MALLVFNALQTTANVLVPTMVQDSLHSAYRYLFSPDQITIVVDEYQDQHNGGMTRNQLFDAAMVYLPTKISPDTRRFKVSKIPTQRSHKIGIEPGFVVVDRFDNNVVLKWKLIRPPPAPYEQPDFLELSFNKKFKARVLDGYLQFVMKESMDIVNNMEKVVKIQGGSSGNDNGGGSVNLEHPVTFDKLAMDPELKKEIIDDLDRDLRKIVVSTTSRTIIVIEDIDCDLDMQVRRKRLPPRYPYDQSSEVTLSGLLNFIDGLWSSCGDERIIVFTTNYKDELDPALLRPGRMDVEIHMSYCTGQGFRILASNYLNIHGDHKLFGEIEDLIAKVEVTPAEVSEQLLRSEDADIALEGVVNFLKRKMEANETEVRKRKRSKIGNGSRKGCLRRKK
ncbi:hypothetical protein Vadar_011217 [Vaccinium darrowii]|uniref:Uncharacterized protein n=1 Tax=Vaccinium darrowii TaxID=229202 RepID=A0ACB7YUE5_9ERIC|nr:hypothetical protein Vadar_011217 [Vaccinium darrowii]